MRKYLFVSAFFLIYILRSVSILLSFLACSSLKISASGTKFIWVWMNIFVPFWTRPAYRQVFQNQLCPSVRQSVTQNSPISHLRITYDMWWDWPKSFRKTLTISIWSPSLFSLFFGVTTRSQGDFANRIQQNCHNFMEDQDHGKAAKFLGNLNKWIMKKPAQANFLSWAVCRWGDFSQQKCPKTSPV